MKFRFNKVIWFLAACLLIAVGLSLVWLSFQPYFVVKLLADSFKNGKGVQSLTLITFPVFVWTFRVLALGILATAPVLLFWRRQAWHGSLQFLSRLPQDTKDFFRALKPSSPGPGITLLLVLIFGLGVIFRLTYIAQPIGHDEGYSYVYFASGPFQVAISDYSLPNNHVFNTILVYLATHLLGVYPWTVRLPALLAGLLLIPAVYLLAARIYNRPVGLIAAALAAWFQVLIYYSVTSRGYSLVALFFITSLLAGSYLLEHKNRFAWGLLSVLCALGFYTVPVFLFPFGIIYAWLFFSQLASPNPTPYRSKLDFVIYLAVSGIAVALMTLLAYMPVFLHSGPDLFFGNPFVASLSWKDFPATIVSRMQEVWHAWAGPVPVVLVWLLVAGFCSNLLLEKRIGRVRFPMQVAALAWIGALLLLRRPNAWEKVWVFAVPVVLMWSAAGLIGLVDLVSKRVWGGRSLAPVVAGGAVLFVLIQGIQVIPTLPEKLTTRGDVEQAALYLKANYQDQDTYLVSFPQDASLWYYVMANGISFPHFQPELGFKRAFVLVSPMDSETLDSVVNDRHLSLSELDCHGPTPVQTFGTLQLFECVQRSTGGG
jgi:hypothetical protein